MEIFLIIILLIIIILLFKIYGRLKSIDVDTNKIRGDISGGMTTIGNLVVSISDQIFSINNSIDTIEKVVQMDEEEKKDFKAEQQKLINEVFGTKK